MPTVRPMRAEDLAAAAVIEQSAPDPWSLPQLREELENEASLTLAACGEKGELLGLCSVQMASCEATLNAITVLPAARRQGVGGALLAALQAELRRRGITELYLEVRRQNLAAQALYEKAWFERTGLRPRFYRSPTDDAVTMRKLNF